MVRDGAKDVLIDEGRRGKVPDGGGRNKARGGGPINEVAVIATNSPDAFARRCGWDLAINHPLNSYATRGPGELPRTVISAAGGSDSALHEPRIH